jgi:tetratricopeptide (TPR) repeat protein
MVGQSTIHNSRIVAVCLLAIVACTSLALPQEQSAPAKQPVELSHEDDATKALRLQALDLYRSGKFVDAMPLLEKLAAINPSDFVVKEHWAYCILQYSSTLTDVEARKKNRLRARALGLEAKKLGDQGEMLEILLSIPEDGSDPKFSERKEVDDAMKMAEASFAKGELAKAREGYLRVLELDPKNYEAAVFVGDVYFKEHAYNSAGEWFDRAIKINPDRETAYRYWGDALAAGGKNDQAREKYINAIIAEPYNRPPWSALRQWANRVNQPFNAILLENKSSAKTQDGKNAVAIDEHSLKQDSPEVAGWNAYNGAHLTWQQEKFKKEFPAEPKYRRSLKEEAEALDMMVKILAPEAVSQKKAEKLDPSLLALIQIDHEGLLEAFVLLNRADREIALDYPAYRAAHRDRLYRYMDEFVLPKASAQASK